jgi:DNA-binding NarL/FixJ family response regulator
MMSNYGGCALVKNCSNIGVRGFLLKNADHSQVESALRAVLMGDRYYSPELALNATRASYTAQPVKFSTTESELVRLMSLGKTTAEISEITHFSSKTIEVYRSRLLAKTNSKNAPELVRFFFSNGLLYSLALYTSLL